jgi:hypothetical protein
VVPESFNVVYEFLLHILKLRWSRRIHPISEHELLPDHDSFFVTDIVESVVFVGSTTPDSNEVEISLNCGFNSIDIDLFRDSRHEHIRRDIICSLRKNPYAINDEVEALAYSVILLHELDGSETDIVGLLVNDLIVGNKLKSHWVQILFAVSSRPPESWVVYGKRK